MTAFSQAIVPGVARISERAGGALPVDVAHVLYEHLATERRYPILTGDPKQYEPLHGLDLRLEPIDDL